MVDVIGLLDQYTSWRPCPGVPSISAWFADDEIPLWQAIERDVGEPVGVPYFCVAWPAAQALASAIERRVIDPLGQLVADAGCGSGVAACAAARAGARRVLAVDSDALAIAAAVELARRHGVIVEPRVASAFEVDADMILAADLVSREEQRAPFVNAVERWLRDGRRVVLADSGRPFFTSCGLPVVDTVQIDVHGSVDSGARREVKVYASPES